MTTESRLYSRAILLEEHRKGTAVEKAVEKVHAELTPKAIDEDDARKWFEAFKGGNEKITDTADVADRCLVENGTFLRSKRSVLCDLHDIEISTLMCQIYGTDGRFQIVCECYRRKIWMVDTLNGTKRPILIDYSAIKQSEIYYFVIEIMYFMAHSRVCGVFCFLTAGTRHWFNGHFDEINLVLHIDMMKFLEDFNNPTFDTRTQPPTLTGFLGFNLCSYTVDVANGNLSEANVINMHHDLWSSIFRNGKLYGFAFAQDWGINTNNLLEISLVDGSKIEHKIEDLINIGIRYDLVSSLWINNNFLVGVHDEGNEISTVYKFDISRMKWEKTTIEVEGRMESINIVNGSLIVQAYSEQNGRNILYRFQYEAVDSLANLVWLSMQRYSLWNSSFHDWFLSKVPKKHKLRSLWN
ncbi:hypothetical protein M3Y94_01212100 [Aphelenchoides besseyi]|nr:hypothetical protein M3Y94_01212100 [Aphelenchoides besseyi]